MTFLLEKKLKKIAAYVLCFAEKFISGDGSGWFGYFLSENQITQCF